jgi:DNA-binding NarL/FixJ family response regulator
LERAARRLGAAEAVRASPGLRPLYWNQAGYERELARARDSLGADGAAAAWEAGRAAAPGESIARALAEEAADESTETPAHVGDPERRARSDRLTAREREVVALAARGLSNRRIAAALVIAERTAGNHLAHVMDKLGLHTRSEIAVWAVTNGLVAGGPDARA